MPNICIWADDGTGIHIGLRSQVLRVRLPFCPPMKEIIEIIRGESNEFNGKKYEDAKIIIRRTCSYGIVEINPPLQVDATVCLEEKTGFYVYDFGMSDKVSLEKESNFLYDEDPFKTIANAVVFDLEHAFNHTDIDPNYNHTHWALRAELWNRVKAWDWFEEDTPEQEQLEFDFVALA